MDTQPTSYTLASGLTISASEVEATLAEQFPGCCLCGSIEDGLTVEFYEPSPAVRRTLAFRSDEVAVFPHRLCPVCKVYPESADRVACSVIVSVWNAVARSRVN